MNLARKTFTAAILAALVFFSFSGRALAQDMMEHTLRSSLYGGLIGGLIGSAVLLLDDNPEDHLGYIATGAGIGILVGAAYGVATSGVIENVGEADEAGFALNLPTIQKERIFDENTNEYEVVEKVDLLKFNF